jgi:hypothetical protein
MPTWGGISCRRTSHLLRKKNRRRRAKKNNALSKTGCLLPADSLLRVKGGQKYKIPLQ